VRVVISGATGLIGQALTRALHVRGDTAVALTRPSTTRAGTATVSWDPGAGHLDMEALNALGQIDAVVHLAGAGIADKRWSQRRKDEIRSSRIRSTDLLARSIAGLDHVPGVFVSGSAIGIYGSRGDEILTESSATGSGFLAEVCQQWEAAAAPATEAGIRTALIRTGIVLTPTGGALAKQLPLFRLGVGGRLSSGSQWFSWISLDDEISAIFKIIGDPGLMGPINLTAPNPVTNAEFTAALGRALHRPTILPVPSAALKAALGGELVEEALLASQRVLPVALERSGFAFSSATLDVALGKMLA